MRFRSNNSKYGNIKTKIDGIVFDSTKESDRYLQLKMLQKAGRISDLQLQVTYTLLPAQYETYERYSKKGKRLTDGKRCIEKPVTYIADFVYTENGKTVVEDAKGKRTTEYIIKRKLMLYVHNVRIKET